MTEEPEPTILNRHCKVYLKTFRAFRKKGIHAYYCHRRADRVADEQFHLTAEEKRRRDEEWLDRGREFKGWRTEPAADKGKPLPFEENVLRVE